VQATPGQEEVVAGTLRLQGQGKEQEQHEEGWPSMKRVSLMLIGALVAALALAATAQAAAPGVSSVSATNLQGVSALLKGTVDPEGLATTYKFAYVDEAGFNANGFAGAATTPSASIGSGTDPSPARTAIGGLVPSTTYHFRLTATNSSGSTDADGSFETTAGFGLLPDEEGFSAIAVADGGGAAVQAGVHPYRLDFDLGFRQGGDFEGQPGVPFPDGDVKDLEIDLPAGLFLNPKALSECTALQFSTPRISPYAPSLSGESCADKSQVGTIEVKTSRAGGETRRFGVFNLTPPPGVTAQIGFSAYGNPVILDLALPQGADGSYAMTMRARNMPQSLDLRAMKLSLWGVPWAVSHNGERGNCLNEAEPQFPWAKCSVGSPTGSPPLAYVSLPTRCVPSLSFGVTATSWQQPGTVTGQALHRDPGANPTALGNCNALHTDFLSQGLLTDDKASSPSGYNFHLVNNVDTFTDRDQLVTPSTKKVVVTLPPGVTVNPSVGAGLGTCSPGQYAAETPFTKPGAGCPNGSKIGDFFAHSPMFAIGENFEGSIYLAQPDDPRTSAPGAENPFDSVVAVYLVSKLPGRGVQIKLPGLIAPDPNSGDIIATFDGLPQLPYTDLDVNFRTGQRSFVITPPACGPAVTSAVMTAWAEELPPTTSSSTSVVESGVGGGPCPPPGTPPFAPEAVAGAYNSNVNAYTPYFVHLTRKDTEQEITSYSLELPKGITGKLAGIPFCSEANIESARFKLGAEETANPSCPAVSQVGSTLTGYGVGNSLTYAPGRVYLGGPYHGAPLSLVTINSATVGPFDLGVIVIRSAFQVDPLTAQLQIDSRASDPIPHILDGIPLHLRDVRIYIDRFEFTHNPSSCSASELISTLSGSGDTFSSSTDDSTATATKHFQLLNCLTIGFRPKLGIRLRGGSKRGDYPSLRASFVARGKTDSNLRRIDVTMPHSEFLAQEHIDDICTRVQFAVEKCPPGSEYGKAVADTPLFDEPLRGGVYLRSSDNTLPDLVANLRSGSFRIVLIGKIGPAKQGIRALFDNVPDAPIKRFTMTLYGGDNGLLVNTANICTKPPLATVRAIGQNNIGASFTTRLRGQCKKPKGGGKGGKK
jgi:hypothetical protein